MRSQLVSSLFGAEFASGLLIDRNVTSRSSGLCCWNSCNEQHEGCNAEADYCSQAQANCGSCGGTWCPGDTPSPTPTPPSPAPSPEPSPSPPPSPGPVPPSSGCGNEPEAVSTTVSNQGKFSVWYAEMGALFWIDSPAFTDGAWQGSIIYAYRASDQQTFEVMRFESDIVGSVMPRKGGGIVLAISKADGDGYSSSFNAMDVDSVTFIGSNLVRLASLPSGSPGKFNNGNCDPLGRYWAGTYCPNGGSCSVWVLESSGGNYTVREGISGIQHPNGLVWNAEGTQLLFSNTGMNAVFKYSYNLQDGTVDNGERFIQGASGLLDSMCGLADGSVVIAQPGSSQLQRYTQEGAPSCTIAVPSNFVASCAFGPNGDMYIPTGRNGADPTGPAGWLYRTSGLGSGIDPTPCDV